MIDERVAMSEERMVELVQGALDADGIFRLPRTGLTASVHQRVNVRVLELVDVETGARVQLEGNRLPVTHSKDLISALTG
jgi:hypothetical protein